MDQKEYYNKIASGELNVRHEVIEYTSQWLEDKVVEFAEIERGIRVLDAGCGRGKLLKAVKECKVFGTDISYGELSYARGEKTVASDLTKLPFRDDTFDRIISMEVVEHLPSTGHVKSAAKEMHRVLKPGGIISLSTPNVNNLNFFFSHLLRGKRNPNPVLHPTMLSSSVLKKIIRDSGFKITKFNTYLMPVPLPKYEYRLGGYTMRALHNIGRLPLFGAVSAGFVVQARKPA